MKTRAWVCAAVLAGAMGARAQTYTVQSNSSQYVPLVGSTPVSAWIPHSIFDPTDEGYFTVPLPFSFPYYGNTYTAVHLDTNGFVTLGAPCPTGCFNIRPIPSTTGTWHNAIAPWFADIEVVSPGQVSYKTGPGQIEIEYLNVELLGGGATATFKIVLTAGGLIQIHYGTATGMWTEAAAGFENSTGSAGAALRPCADSCTTADFPTHTLFVIGQPVQPDLVVEQVTLNSVQRNASNLTVSLTPTFRNFGQNAATGFVWRAFLSTDRAYQPTDTLLFTSSTPLSLSGTMTSSDTGVATIPAPPVGNYYVLVEVDHLDAVAEGSFGESNNVGATISYFVQGLDLVATAVGGPANTGPGNNVTLRLNYFNQGTDPVPGNGEMGYRVYLSTDNMWSANDFQLYPAAGDAVKVMVGGQTVSEDVTFPVPANVPGGDFYYVLRLDPQGLITEGSETNNTIASTAKVNVRQADLVIKTVDVLDPATQSPVRRGLFGSPARVRVTAANEGGADARTFKVGVVISADSNLSLLQDVLVIETAVTVLPMGGTQTFDIDFTIPLTDRSNRPFTSGNYFFFALLDSSGQVTELNEFNNNLMLMQPVLLKSPAPDLTVVRFDAPSAAGLGEIAPVYRIFKNIGNVDAPEVRYRYYLSANANVTVDDLPLQILNGSTLTASGAVTLAQAQSSVSTEFVQLPANITPGTYYLGAVLDTDSQVLELDEANNGLASAPVQIAPGTFRVCTASLPDAVLGRPYSFQLSSCGDAPGMPTIWSVDPSQGAMPQGLSLSPGGLITGAPSAETVTGLTVVATNNSRTAVGRLALRVLPTTTQVEITTSALPALINSPTQAYETYLGAAGGVKPYQWRVVPVPGDVDLRNNIGIALGNDGKLSGFPRAGAMERNWNLTVEVRDVLGTTARRALTLRVVSPGSIVYTSLTIPDALVGVEYVTDVSVKNFDNSPLAKDLHFDVVAGALPAGVRLTTQGEVGLLEGTPTRAGLYAFTVEVVDAKGRSASSDFLLRVHPARLSVEVKDLPAQYRPGDPVDFSFVVPSGKDVRFNLFSGALPTGTTLSPDGRVTGTVASTDREGSYNFVVEASDPTGASGLGVFSVAIKSDPPRAGCSTTPVAGVTMGLAALILAAARRRSRRGAWATAVWAAACLVAPLAYGQDYQPLGPTAVTYSSPNAPTSVSAGATVPIPFPFRFYGQTLAALEFSQYGYLTPQSNDSFANNPGIPNSATSPPSTFIAPWWDSLCPLTSSSCPGQLLRHQVLGAPPNRYMVFEWYNFAASTTTASQRFSFQVLLYEGTNEVRFAYGSGTPATGSATVGISKELGIGVAGLNCTTASGGNCSNTNFPPSTIIRFQLPPDLTIPSVSMDQVGYAGVRFNATAQVANVGGREVTQNLVRYFLSADSVYQASDTAIGESFTLDFPAGATTLATTNLQAKIPVGTAPGTYFVLSWVDPDNSAIAESSETNNFGPPQQISIGAPTADLITQAVTAPASAAPGAMVSVGRTFSNVGNAPAASFKYTWFLSDNSVVSISDTPLGSASQVSDLLPMMGNTQTDMVTLPSNLAAGQYWLGACVNYDPQGTPQFGLTEISQVNNCNQAPMPTIISSGALAVVTQAALPQATQFSPYGVRLRAAGGTGSYAWALASGSSLPAGLNFNTNGDLLGTPAVAGSFSFSVVVSSGGSDVTQQMSLMIVPGNIPLSIVDQDLPAAEFGRAYQAPLVAVGGRPPYVWKLKSDSRLPTGLALSFEGSLEGRANESGEFSFSVEVSDGMMTKVSKDLRVRVVNPTSLHIATSRLKTALLKQDYSQQLQAVGGKSPYTWTLLKFQQLPENITEKPGMLGDAFPDNFGIHIDDGNLDYLRGEPKAAGLYALTFKVTDANSAEDTTTLLLSVNYNEPIAITTVALPDAFVDREYQVKLSHNRSKESTGVVFSIPCVQQATSPTQFACAPTEPTQTLPDGLKLMDDGSITGTPSASAQVGQTYSFLVKVVDDAGRQDVRSLSIRVRSVTEPSGGNCSGTGLGPAALAALLLALARRKRAL